MSNISRVKAFLRSPTAKLAMTYLLIILLMSICFSIVIYNTSSHELGRQVPPDRFFSDRTFTGRDGNGGASPEVHQFFQDRLAEAKGALITHLVILNSLMLVGGAIVSYWLARRNLQPIEAAMDAQTQFVSDASHELRTPLTAIQTSNEVALRKPKLSIAEARQLIENNTTDIARLKSLSDGLLNLARQDKAADVVLAPVKLQDVVSDASNQIIELATVKKISVQDDVANISVLTDKFGLERVLVILLDNAVKYSHEKGTIYLKTREKGKAVYLDIHDKGIGIRASDIPHLFRRFYRADNSRTSGASSQHGYGLGLAIAQQIMHGQQGDITVVSTPGKGSTFTLKLNRA